MRAYRILLAGLAAVCGADSLSAQTPLFDTTKPASTAAAGQLPPMSALLPSAGQVPQPTEMLTAPATGLSNQAIPGAVYSPWNPDVGGNGPITYETYLRTGASLLADAGAFNGRLQTGYVVQGGGRSLLFNTAGDAAWVADIGLSYTFNRGERLGNPLPINANSLKGSDPSSAFTIPLGIRTLKRTSFNFGLGRDWFLNGPGVIGGESCDTNWRFGADFGGRWGTASVGFEPQAEPEGYRRRQGVFHGVYAGSGVNWERNIGACTLLAGFRAEYSYSWTNLIPPNDGDIQDVNLLLMLGVRF